MIPGTHVLSVTYKAVLQHPVAFCQKPDILRQSPSDKVLMVKILTKVMLSYQKS